MWERANELNLVARSYRGFLDSGFHRNNDIQRFHRCYRTSAITGDKPEQIGSLASGTGHRYNSTRFSNFLTTDVYAPSNRGSNDSKTSPSGFNTQTQDIQPYTG